MVTVLLLCTYVQHLQAAGTPDHGRPQLAAVAHCLVSGCLPVRLGEDSISPARLLCTFMQPSKASCNSACADQRKSTACMPACMQVKLYGASLEVFGEPQQPQPFMLRV